MTTKSSKKGAITLCRIDFSRYLVHVTISRMLHYWMLFSCSVWVTIRLDLMFGWLVVMHTYLHYFLLPLSLSRHHQVGAYKVESAWLTQTLTQLWFCHSLCMSTTNEFLDALCCSHSMNLRGDEMFHFSAGHPVLFSASLCQNFFLPLDVVVCVESLQRRGSRVFLRYY